MQILNFEFWEDRQSVGVTYLLEHEGKKLRIMIKCDSFLDQSYAVAEIWSRTNDQWNPMASIHPCNMKSKRSMNPVTGQWALLEREKDLAVLQAKIVQILC